jgi:hypothetical protein
MKIAPFMVRKPISSAWAILLPELPSIPIVSLSIRKKEPQVMFRDFFVHLDFQKGKFELPAPEIWVASHT